MKFKHNEQIDLKNQLLQLDLSEEIVDKIIIHQSANDNWIKQLSHELQSSNTHTQALEKVINLFMLRNNTHKQNIGKKDIVKIIPISQRKLDDLIRARLIPFVEINQKSRFFNIDEVYKYIEKFKVDSLINKVDPITLNNLVNQIGK